MNRISMRRAAAYAAVLVATLALAPSAFAHAELFPNQIPSGDGYLLSLTVPNEKEGASTTQIQVTMPASALTFVPDGSARRASAEVYIGAIDDSGRMSDIAREETTFTLSEGQDPAATPVVYSATLQTRKGNHRIVVNIRDKASGRMGTAKADIRVE